MRTKYVDERRVFRLNRNEMPGEGTIIYLMSREQRIDDNWALLYAIELCSNKNYRLSIVYMQTDVNQMQTERSIDFLLSGLKEVEARAGVLGLHFDLINGCDLPSQISNYAEDSNAAAIVCDFSPLRDHRVLCGLLASEISIPLIEVDGHNIVPCRYVSDKQEYGAFTLRRKIEHLLPVFLGPIPPIEDVLNEHNIAVSEKRHQIDWHKFLDVFPKPLRVKPVRGINPGPNNALKKLELFIEEGLGNYAEDRNDPTKEGQSGLSPYLHFGQLAPQRAAFEAARKMDDLSLKGGFLDEIIVRRELSDNFCLYNPNYDNSRGFPSWAAYSLDAHVMDKREYLYDFTQLEQAETHEALWNAAQRELINNGKMHGYMRMYWAKKILEWTSSASEAMLIAVSLNDKYSLDGRDPNGYAGCAWAIGGLHDRAWGEREVFGKVRYMNEKGCRRKFDTDAYINKNKILT